MTPAAKSQPSLRRRSPVLEEGREGAASAFLATSQGLEAAFLEALEAAPLSPLASGFSLKLAGPGETGGSWLGSGVGGTEGSDLGKDSSCDPTRLFFLSFF